MNETTVQTIPTPVGEIAEVPPLVAYWYAAIRWKWLIVGVVALFVAAALVVSLLATPVYTARARIEISRQAEQVTNLEAVEQIDTGKDNEFYQTQYSLLRARSLAERVARQLNLASDEEFFALHGIELEQGAGVPSTSERTDRLRTATAILLANINVLPIRDSSLVDIEFASPDPQFAARVANAWVEQFIASTLERRFASTRDARGFLEERLAELRGRMEESERNLVNYAANTGILTLTEETDPTGRTRASRTVTSADLEALNSALAVATNDRIRAESALRSGPGIATQASNPAVAGLRQERAEAAAQLAQLSTRFEEGYPEIQALQARVNALDRAISAEENRGTSGLRNDYEIAASRENALRAMSSVCGK